ncbi:hypothetical protein CDD80_969 [Ophiocordyceps camponoti-rufipedis]|uniref:OPT family small oligopeptide transporter n=1 Tax=Ophiocordyceps camponoti-rufipedis TaxID=2004952 RepID=A0A2C5Z5E7_9HYPO|nr:hypothetical protein CDD80_969 [Ophiocordyceps camponoti-rufipedis]
MASVAEATGVEGLGPKPSHRRSVSLDSLDGLDGLIPERENAPLMVDDEEYELRNWQPRVEGAQVKAIDEEGDDDEEEEDSPYAEVRAAIGNRDEDVPCSTIRAWVIGLLLVLVGASTNTLFSLRQPSISVGALVGQILAWPLGHGWARFLPDWQVPTPFGRSLPLNPGPFTIKEHSIIGVMASVSFSVAYSTDIILAQLVFYKQDFGFLFQMLLTISTQSLGYGIAGAMRKYLVYPASMIWPGILVSVTMMNVMYEEEDDKKDGSSSFIGSSMPRYRWFGLVTAGAFVYYFIPGFLVQCLSVFAFATWMAPQNVVINQLFGGTTGLSLMPLTLDWTQIAGWVGSPLIPPWYAIANVIIGVSVFFVFGCSVLHYSGAWYAPFLPMSDATTYDNTGKPYNTSRVLKPDFTLDEDAYRAYSPLFISTSFAMAYGLAFAGISSLIVHTYLHYRKQIWQQYRNSTGEKPDIHMKLMSRYSEAPMWWYLSLFVAMLALGLYTVLAYPTQLSWWAYLLAVGISYGFSLPIGIIEAVTSSQIGLNVLTEFIYGYIQPGRPLALMIFKTFGSITMGQALRFIADLKFGHYMKIPPKTMFFAQVIATTLSCVVQITTLNLALGSIEDVCDIHQRDRFTCPGGRVFFSASVIWGLIGPDRIFSPGRIYQGLFLFFVLGAVTPIIIHFASKRYPSSPIKYLMAPLIFGGAGAIPPATPLNYFSWAVVGFVFQYYIKRRHFRWWSRLNFLTSCGLDLGLALGTLFIFFAFSMHGIKPPQWWPNTVVSTTMDVQGTAIQAHVAEGQRFGPDVW